MRVLSEFTGGGIRLVQVNIVFSLLRSSTVPSSMAEVAAVLKAAGEICKQSGNADSYRSVLENAMEQVRRQRCADETDVRAFVDYDCSRRSLLLAIAGNDESRLRTNLAEFASLTLIWNEMRKTRNLNPAKFTSLTSKVLDKYLVNDDLIQRSCRQRLGIDEPSDDGGGDRILEQTALLGDTVASECHDGETGNELEEAFDEFVDEESTIEGNFCSCIRDSLEAALKCLGCAVVHEEF